MADRKISRKLKGKVLMCVTPAYLYDLETVALTGRQQQRLQVCEKDLPDQLGQEACGSEVGGWRMMDALREEIDLLMSLMGRLVIC